jgi:bifunctional non-homologous end joining protein LigD
MPRQAQIALPWVAPILVSLRDQPFSSPEWLFEPKYDGFRGIFYLTRRGCAMFSRRGNHFRRFDELCRRIAAELPRREAILDGEVVAIDKAGRMDFYGLMRGEGHLAYAVFDLLWLNRRDLRFLPLSRRKKRLERLIPGTGHTLVRVPSFQEHGRELFQAACQLDLEGIVAKRAADPYAPETCWYKIKNPSYTQAEGRGELFERRI